MRRVGILVGCVKGSVGGEAHAPLEGCVVRASDSTRWLRCTAVPGTLLLFVALTMTLFTTTLLYMNYNLTLQ